MHIKKLLILINVLSISFVCSQTTSKDILRKVNHFKVEVYKAIVLSEEFKSNKNCHIVGINTVSLNMEYSGNGPIRFFFYDIQITKDSISVQKLREELSKKYWIFEDSSDFLGIGYREDYIDNIIKTDSLYIPDFFQDEVCKFNYDIIKIYQPLDKWLDFHSKSYNWNLQNYEVVIPVKYESLSKGHMFKKKNIIYLKSS